MHRADRDCTPVITMTQRWVHVNPQSEMMSQHQTKSDCYNTANTAGILVSHKSKSTVTSSLIFQNIIPSDYVRSHGAYFLHKHGNIATERNPKSGLCPTLYSAQCHRQHYTIQAYEQFETLDMYNLDDKQSTTPAYEPSTIEFRATNGSN